MPLIINETKPRLESSNNFPQIPNQQNNKFGQNFQFEFETEKLQRIFLGVH